MDEVRAVDIDPPGVSNIGWDQIWNGFANFVTGNPRASAAIVVVIVLMVMWKRPLWRGILIGILGVIAIMFVVANS